MDIATREDIITWFKAGKKSGATHMIVVCDEFSMEDYPVYVSSDQDVHKTFEEFHCKNMQRVVEVYNFALGMGAQLNEYRAMNF